VVCVHKNCGHPENPDSEPVLISRTEAIVKAVFPDAVRVA
jgi:hypothetical protein